MRLSDVKPLVFDLFQTYFAGANVSMARQSRIPKPKSPLVLLTYGTVSRAAFPRMMLVDGVNVEQYESSVVVDVDLFTHGKPIKQAGTDEILAYDNTAVEDMSSFMDFLDSEYTIEWSDIHSITILREGDIQDLSGLINETSYEFRARMTLRIYYVSLAVEYAGVLSEDSIVYPTGEYDEHGQEIYAPGAPVRKTSTSGYYGSPEEEIEKRAKISAQFEQTPSGGGSDELAEMETGYYTEIDEIDIKVKGV